MSGIRLEFIDSASSNPSVPACLSLRQEPEEEDEEEDEDDNRHDDDDNELDDEGYSE